MCSSASESMPPVPHAQSKTVRIDAGLAQGVLVAVDERG